MIEKKILLNDIKKMSGFVNETFKLKGDMTIKHDKYIINGRSLLGILSLDLSLPVICEIEECDEQAWDINCKRFEVE